MGVRGTVRAGGEPIAVSGLAWMDREWSTSALGPELVGWDWVALQLDDGRDLMVYRLRRRDGTADPHSAGALIAADGTTRPLAPEDVGARRTLGHWTSPRSGVRYPSRWRLAVPAAGLDLEIVPRLPDQELTRRHPLLGGGGAGRGHRRRPARRGPRLRGAGRLRGVSPGIPSLAFLRKSAWDA